MTSCTLLKGHKNTHINVSDKLQGAQKAKEQIMCKSEKRLPQGVNTYH